MKIDGSYKYPSLSPATAKPVKSQDAPASDAAASVNLGASSGLLTSGNGEFNTEKVEKIKTAIGQGGFAINSSAISERLLSMAKELLAHGK
ncbi:MAG: flagellar biosynthesis anti-sigma factor FlgM [Azonexus sp.]|nr:flagellar biosynthesis anti-sigma factor FlgM [Azonexus sp.]MCK6411228.1 flagellar biosynthesis anti-sigma factor FlgM [Azonexus sp.]